MSKNQNFQGQIKQQSSGQKRIQQKSKLIQMLQQKNSTLNKQIQRINRMMQQSSKNHQQKLKEQLKKQKLIQTTNDPQILNRELKNCYKKIQLYQYEVQKLKQKSLSINTSQKMVSMETQLKQKKVIQDKLKSQLYSLVKQISQNSKKLSLGNYQVQFEKDLKNKSDQLKFLKQMIKQYQTKDSIKQKNLKLQYNHIKKIQKQFVQKGGSLNQLDAVKHKALSQFQQGRLKQTKNQSSQDNYYQRFNKNNSKSLTNNINSLTNNNSYTNQQNPQTQIIQDRTRSFYESLQNQLSVLQKLNKKYQKQLDQSQKNLIDIQGKSELTRKRLQKIQNQIQQLNSSIKVRKTCIVAENMKPTHRRSVRSVNVKQDMLNISQVVKQIPNKRKRNIINMTAISNAEHRLYNN